MFKVESELIYPEFKKISPCPLCKATASVRTDEDEITPNKYVVACDNIKCQIYKIVKHDTPEKAIVDWNIRDDSSIEEKMRPSRIVYEARVDGFSFSSIAGDNA